MKTAFAKPPNRTQSYTKFATPLVLESPRHSGLGAILLSRGKHLLGTSDDCTVPLRASDVQPRHALIVVSEHRTVVKALDPRTWVNDGPVSEMALRPGDRLSIGPLTFRVRAADAEELASFDEIPEHSFPADFFQEPAPVVEPPAKTGALRETARELSLPIVTTPELAKTTVPAMPLPAPVSGPLTSFTPSATARDASPVAEIKAAESRLVPPPLPHAMEAVASLLPPPAPIPVVSVKESPATRSAEPAIDDTAATETLDLKLDEIQRTLSELQLPTELSSTAAASDNAVRADALTAERRQFSVRQDDLQRRAEELARQSQLLRERVARVAEREVEVERSLARLALEHEQLATTAEVTRKELDDEYARHMTLWQEWDAAYRRTSGELNGQLQSMEQRRTALLAEGDRLANERSELQRLQAEHERDRRVHAAERVQLTTDRAALQSLRAEFDTERQQHLVAVQEREASVAAERTALAGTQEELLATRQQLERERSEFLAVRSTEALRREQELREHVERREQLETDHSRIQTRMLELNELERVLAAERSALVAQRDEFAKQQSGVFADREELSQLRSQLHTTAATVLQLQRERDDFQLAAVTSLEAPPQIRFAEPQAKSHDFDRSIPVPPPIPANWNEDATSVVGAIEEPIPAASFAEVRPLTFGVALPTNTSNAVETSLGEALSMIADGVSSHLEATSEDRPTSAISLPERELAPAPAPAPATVHRFWEDNTLYDTSVEGPSQPPLPSRVAASSNLMMSSESVLSQEPVPPRASDAKPSLDELLANVGRGLANVDDSSLNAVETEPAAEFESQVATATAIAEPPLNADETLAEVNRQFGVPVATPQEEALEPQKPALPSWWSDAAPTARASTSAHSVAEVSETASPDAQTGSLLESLQRSVESESPSASAAESATSDPLLSLRAQLAQMFDLSASERAAASAAEAASLDDSGAQQDSAEVIADDEVLETMSPPTEASELELPADSETNVEEQNNVESVDSIVVEALLATVSVEPKPAMKPETEAEANGEVEDSMETYLARLLSRARGTDVSEHEVKSLTAKPTRTTAASKSSDSSSSDETEPTAAFDPSDRSHLTAEPKHKQDRQAAREDLQQFRQVAHQSARSALARHTSKALLSAVIAKSMLLGISVTALCAYVGAPLMGLATPAWKGVACTFTTGLCIMEVHRSWLQLHGWRKTGQLPVKKASPLMPSAAPSGEVALAAAKSETESAPASAS